MLEYAEVFEIVQKVLVANGWSARPAPTLGIKMYDTAVGPRQAAAYLSRGDEYNRTVMGDYQSEGRNVLGGSGKLIPLDADTQAIETLALTFCSGADKDIDQSYARGLYLIGVRNTDNVS
jgi:hypothetical protein